MSIVFLLLFLLSCTSSVLSTKDDEIILLKMKKQLGDPDILRNWTKGFQFCGINWFTVYIECTSTGRVSKLSMRYFNVSAPFPDAICDLTELEYLEISNFYGLYDSIPSCITKLVKLSFLEIRETSISGPVPSFSKNTNLVDIILSNNHLSGPIPPSLSNLPNLSILNLGHNYLTGTIPPGIVLGHSPFLFLNNNNLTGEIPKCYGSVDFFLIDIGNNQLSGDASFLFGKQKIASQITLRNNYFAFDLSYVEFSDMLAFLDLSHNKIYGNVPDSIASATRLSLLDLSFNKLCGELPKGGNMWRFYAEEFVNNTCLCGNPLPPCFSSAPALAPESITP